MNDSMKGDVVPCPYISRGGLKLAAALDAFGIDVSRFVCADLGCNVGGFTDCLLQRGVSKVWAVDTGYGTLAWKLRQDDRVEVHERTNVLHLNPDRWGQSALCDLVTIDLGWTRQRYAVPAAKRWLSSRSHARIITLIKPHYEAHQELLVRGVLAVSDAESVLEQVLEEMPEFGVDVVDRIRSPIRGGKGKSRVGNVEYLAMLKPVAGGT